MRILGDRCIGLKRGCWRVLGLLIVLWVGCEKLTLDRALHLVMFVIDCVNSCSCCRRRKRRRGGSDNLTRRELERANAGSRNEEAW